MAVRAANIAFFQFDLNASPRNAIGNHLADVACFAAANMIEFQNTWIGLATIDT